MLCKVIDFWSSCLGAASSSQWVCYRLHRLEVGLAWMSALCACRCYFPYTVRATRQERVLHTFFELS